MKWKKVSIDTTVEAEDLVSLMLSELGVEGVQIENQVPVSEEDIRKMYIDILPEMLPDDGTSRVTFFLHEEDGEEPSGDADSQTKTEAGTLCGSTEKQDIPTDDSYTIHDRIWKAEEIEELLELVRENLAALAEHVDIGKGTLEIGNTEETDWRDNWKQFFQPILIGKLLILPSWLPVPEDCRQDVEAGKLSVVIMDPGTAFGTGEHETTKLCIPELERTVKEGSTVLDLGTGSGILAMAAERFGASFVLAEDIDPECEKVLRENLQANGIPEKKIQVLTGNVLADPGFAEALREAPGIPPESAGYGPYDVAAANILAPVIEALAAPGLTDRFLKRGGTFITSGILKEKKEEVLSAFERNPSWGSFSVTEMGDWVCICAVRN